MPLPSSLASVIRAFDIRAQEEVYTALPAVVQKYDPAKNTVDLQIAVKDARRSEDGSPVYLEFPSIPEVPVNLPRGGGYILTLPLVPGDSGLLVISTLDVGSWELSGQVPSEPLNLLRQNLSSCVFVPGWFPFTSPPSPADVTARTTKAVFGQDGGTQIQIGAQVNLGGDPAAAPLARTSELTAQQTLVAGAADFNAFKAAVAAWVIPGTTKVVGS